NSAYTMMKHAQEIAENGDQPPEIYFRKQDEEYGANNVRNAAHVITAAAIPVIDFSLLNLSQSELDKLKSAATLGCFQVINHGIESSFLEEVREISKLFFKLPADEKKKCLKEQNDVQGYGNEMVLSDNQTLDWTDRLYLTVLPQHQRRLQFWPQNPTHFR
ncbi:SRG1-like protein, partial [Tanacetum coccineum]